jgi:lipopolysaccharide biosynthesis glycosyltransferase
MHDTPVVFAFDAKYGKHCAVAMNSVLKHSSARLKVHCISDDALDEDIARLRRISDRYNSEISFHRGTGNHFVDWKVSGHISTAAYYRILIPYLISSERALYLDSDLIATCDIVPLLETDLRSCLIAGCADFRAGQASAMPKHSGDTYLNTGVLLMDLNALKRCDFLKACRTIEERCKESITFADQCVINEFAKFRKLLIDPRWNILINEYENRSLEQNIGPYIGQVILHGAGTTKPWVEWADPWIFELWRTYTEEVLNSFDEIVERPKTVQDFTMKARSLSRQGKHEEAAQLRDRLLVYLVGQADEAKQQLAALQQSRRPK